VSHVHPSAHADRRLGFLVFTCALAVYVATAGGSLATTDAAATYDVTRQIVEQGTVALSADLVGNEAFRGPDGRSYSPFGLLQSIWNIPFYLAGRLAAGLPGGRGLPVEVLTKAVVALGNTVAAALCVWLVWLLGWHASGGRARTAVWAALIAAFATSLWPYSKFGFNAPLSAVLVTASVYLPLAWAETGRARTVCLAGAVCGLALLTRHELALIAIPSLAVIASARRHPWWKPAVWWAAGAAPSAIVWLWYNHVRFGSVLETGYFRDQTIGMGGSLAAGLWGLLLSPGASVFLYSPVVVPALVALAWARRDHPRLAWTIVSLGVIYTLFYAQMASFAGGRSYGPRYLVPLLPVLGVPLALWMYSWPSRTRRWLVAWCVASALVQLPGVLVDFAKVRVAYARQFDRGTYEQRMHSWEACPLVLNTRAAVAAVPAVVSHLTGRGARPAVDWSATTAGARDFSQQFAFSLDFWWIYLFYLGAVPAWLSVAIGLLLSGLGAGLASAAWARAKGAGGR
jgi:hypothetical protein